MCGCELDLSGTGRVEGSCEHGNECLGSIIHKELFINQMTAGLLRKDWLFVVN